MVDKTWYGSVNVDGLRVASYEGSSRDNVVNNIMHYAFQYVEEAEKRITITIQKAKDNGSN